MIVRFQPTAPVEWRAYRDTETDGWLSVCDTLGRSAVGETWARLCATIFETQHALFNDLFVQGELASFLKNHGWQLETQLPDHLPEGDVTFDIPTVVQPMPGMSVHPVRL